MYNLDFDEYQKRARETAIYPEAAAVTYPLIGLVGEVGEFANKWKKTIRDGRELDFDDAKAELGDVLWYLSQVATDLDIPLSSVAYDNIKKLEDRKARNVLGGSGDNR